MSSDSKLGSFIDRCPGIDAAGTETEIVPGEGVARCMRYLSVEDEVESVINVLKKKAPNVSRTLPQKNPPYVPNPSYYGFNTEVARTLIQPKKSFIQTLKDELNETSKMPIEMSSNSKPFGKPSILPHELIGGELINPRKCPHIVEQEANKGKELYKISHNAYSPGEHVKKDPTIEYPSNLIFGKTKPKSYNGKSMKTILTWIDQNEISTTSQRLAYFRYRHNHELGKSLNRIGIPNTIDPCWTFGKKEIMKSDGYEKDFSTELAIQVAYIHRLKDYLRKKKVNLVPLMIALKEEDSEDTQILQINHFFDLCHIYGLDFDRDKVDPICKRLKIYTEDGNAVYYKQFYYLIHPAEDVPDFGERTSKSTETTYESEYMTMCEDLKGAAKTKLEPAAGITTLDTKLSLPPSMCRAQQEDLPSETRAHELLNPNIFLQYGLNHRDFFQPRSRMYMKDLWTKVGINLPDDIFNLMWEEGERRDGIGNVSVETFRNMLDEISTGKLEQLTPLG